MATTWEFGQGLQLPCYLFEGVVTTRTIFEPSGQVKGYEFSAEISKGDVVQIWESTVAGEAFIVKPADVDSADPGVGNGNESGAIGIVITEPELINTPASTPFTQSVANDMRRATVEWFGYSAVREVTITEANVAGDAVGFDAGAGEFTSDTASAAFKPFTLVESSSAAGSHHILV